MFEVNIRSSYKAHEKIKVFDEFIQLVSDNLGLSKDFLLTNNKDIKQDRSDEDKIRYFEIKFYGNLLELGDKFVDWAVKSRYDDILSLEMSLVKTLKAMILEGHDVKYAPVETTNIHLPSNELFSVKKTKLLEDSCTNLLQECLDDGWRIIACIPRAGQRRPDYILGI